MNKKEAIEWVVDEKAISAFTRNFVEWLYDHNYMIVHVNFVVGQTASNAEDWNNARDAYSGDREDK